MHRRAQVMLIALALDASLPELPNAVHPVVAMGRWLSWGERLAPQRPWRRLAWGAGWLASGLALSGGIAACVPRQPLVQGVLAHTLFAYRALDRAVEEVQAALSHGDLTRARWSLGWHLVSRPTDELDQAEVAAAAIESLSENLSDSLIAPLCWFAIGGLPALAAYRFCNTADAMWGYHNERYEYLGKAAARCDDLLNVVPARLTALLLALATHWLTGRGDHAWRVAWRDHDHTASPNAGWPMAAMAGALDTTLVKIGHYRLGDGSLEPDAVLVARARRVARVAVGMVVAAIALGWWTTNEETA